MNKWSMSVVLICMAFLTACSLSNDSSTTQNTTPADNLLSIADAEYQLLAQVYEHVAPSVVNVSVTRLSSTGATEIEQSSGIVFNDRGHIVTTAHTVDGARSILVIFNDGVVAEAQLQAEDVFSDIAVLRIAVEPDILHPIAFGDSDAVRIGERAIAIGNPFGLSASLTTGAISGLGRPLPSAQIIDSNIGGFQNPSIIQVDANINPGYAGGPLLNSSGEFIGMNLGLDSTGVALRNFGFAVPAATVQRVVPALIASGRVDYAWIGISSVVADNGFGVAGLAQVLNLPVQQGILISSVTPDSPADKAGLRGGNRIVMVRDHEICAGGDIITRVNDRYINGMDDFLAYLVTNTEPGTVINLLVIRNGDTLEVPVTLESRPLTGISDPGACGQ